MVPAIGCTEPICVALAVSKATELLGSTPAKIEAQLSANILKNAMGVGIPGTGMVGLPIAIALGALVGRSEYGLEVLRDSNPEAVARGKEYIAADRIHVALKADAPHKLYVEITCYGEDGHQATAIIVKEHTHFAFLKKDEEVILDELQEQPAAETVEAAAADQPKLNLTLRKVYEYATTTPLEELEFINEAKRLNEAAAQSSLKGNYGHCLGKVLSRPLGRGIMGESIFSHILSSTSSACDARMAGAMIPVMSNSGSGNQGICATNPVVVFAEENHNTAEETTRALVLSHLTAIYIKLNLGTLS
ncbi:inner membrane protein, partial [gut metagenome]